MDLVVSSPVAHQVFGLVTNKGWRQAPIGHVLKICIKIFFGLKLGFSERSLCPDYGDIRIFLVRHLVPELWAPKVSKITQNHIFFNFGSSYLWNQMLPKINTNISVIRAKRSFRKIKFQSKKIVIQILGVTWRQPLSRIKITFKQMTEATKWTMCFL